jgi:hypothetical protein
MASLDAGQLRAVLLHELAHIKRGDLWMNLAQTILQIVYFYNPFVWIANAIIRRIREQAVDEMVLVAMGDKARQYPQTLLDVAKLAFKKPTLSLRLIGVVESKNALAGRIKRILTRPVPRTSKLGILGLIAIIITAVILLPMAKAQKQAGQMTDVQVAVESADKQVIPATKNLQSLIDAAKPGDTVTVPKGLYTDPVEINKSLTIKGESRNECIFEVTANKPAIFIDTKGKGNVVIEGLTIKWQLATSNKSIERPFALGVKDTKAEIKDCSFLPLGNFQRSPVAVRADGLTQLNISKCRFEGFEYVICYGEGTKGKTSDCLIMNCGHQGIINYTGSTLTVERNVITGSKFHAVRCTGGTLYVKDNLLINNDNRGIYLGNRSGSGTITNNLIIGNGTGIGCFARSKYEIKNNIIADSSYAGIGMEKSCLLTIQDNIFVHNERGWIMFDRGEKGANTCDRNTFWQNKVDAENFEKSANSINANPDFVDPNNGDFSLRPGPALEYKQGLTNPQIFKELWKIWKKRENRNETAVQVEGKMVGSELPVGMVGTWFFDNTQGDDEQMAVFPDSRIVVLYSNGHKDQTRYVDGFVELAEYNNIRCKMTLQEDGTLLHYLDDGGSMVFGKRWKRIDTQPRTDILKPLTGQERQDPNASRGRIRGVVVNAATGQPVAGAYVGVGDFGDSGGSNYERHRAQGFFAKAETDRQGRFILDGLD